MHARRTTLALFFFWLSLLNKFLSQILENSITSKWFEIFWWYLVDFFFFLFGFYGPFKNISLISSRLLIRGGGKPEYPEKNHLTYRCRTWHLTCDPSEARTHSGERIFGRGKDKGSRHDVCKRDNSHFFIMYLCSLKPKSFAGHNSHTVWDNLIIIGRNIHEGK